MELYHPIGGNAANRVAVDAAVTLQRGVLVGNTKDVLLFLIERTRVEVHLAAKGIAVRGDVRRERVRDGLGKPPASCTVVAVYERKFDDLITRLNKDSQNLFAECFLKTVGFYGSAKETGTGEGSYETGPKYVMAFLKQIDAPVTPEVRIDDGSGFSHHNRVTPHLLTYVLRHMYRSPKNKVFLASLPIAGEDGTLERRMRDIRGAVRAKTGYINGVYALSGYAMSRSGKVYCFSVLCNDVRSGSAKGCIDDICRAMVNDAPAKK